MPSPADSNVDDDASSNPADARSDATDTSPNPADARSNTDATSNTVLNAVIGAVVTVVLTFTAFSPILGGAVAGYLEKRDGLRVGAISGAIAALPILLFSLLSMTFLGLFALQAVGVFLLVLFVAFPLILLWVVGLSALGGVLGVYLAEEL